MNKVVVLLVVALAILHQDFWWWDDPTPVFGFMPVGLAWHMGISLAAGLVWLLAVKYCWPEVLESAEDAPGEAPGDPLPAVGNGEEAS